MRPRNRFAHFDHQLGTNCPSFREFICLLYSLTQLTVEQSELILEFEVQLILFS